jgi:DNA-binding MarR family transcriptional regulator
VFVSNVSLPGDDVKGAAGVPDASARPAAGHEALEISKLLVEVLQVGHATRRHAAEDLAGAGGDSPAGASGGAGFHAAGSGPGQLPAPISAHVIRAAIHVYTHGPQTIGQLATGLGVSQGWASRVVDEMERAGYLERQRDPQDRRVVRVSLAPAAVERVERAYTWRGDAVEAALDGLAEKERAAVRTFLARFVEAARAEG